MNPLFVFRNKLGASDGSVQIDGFLREVRPTGRFFPAGIRGNLSKRVDNTPRTSHLSVKLRLGLPKRGADPGGTQRYRRTRRTTRSNANRTRRRKRKPPPSAMGQNHRATRTNIVTTETAARRAEKTNIDRQPTIRRGGNRRERRTAKAIGSTKDPTSTKPKP